MGSHLVACALGLAMVADAAAARDVTIDARARSIQPGEIVMLTMTLPPDRPSVRVRAFDRDQPVYAAGDRPSDPSRPEPAGGRVWVAIVGIDLDVAPGRHPVTIDADGIHATHVLVVQRKAFPTRKLTVDEAFVNPPEVMRERIERDARTLAGVWAAPAPSRLWTEPFVRPVPQPANSRFGTRSIYNGAARSAHGGADFLSPSGTPVHAPNAGRIAIAHDLYFTGNTVVIDHGLGVFSMLAHLSSIDVREGDVVTAGQIVGRVGATGRVTGPHLHWAVRAGGARVDPIAVLALLGSETP